MVSIGRGIHFGEEKTLLLTWGARSRLSTVPTETKRVGSAPTVENFKESLEGEGRRSRKKKKAIKLEKRKR